MSENKKKQFFLTRWFKRMFFGTREEFLRSEVGKYFALMHGGGKV